ncbi:MAG: hypothetical protein KAI81_06965, partial [Candidatus Marinimicrobia bacterium]|nr:hypothetical protein [Candidatus Neomarinimicrobiota bacterium]
HANAKLFADIVNSSEHFSVDTAKLHTNIVMIDVSNTKNVADVTATLENNGVRLLSISPQRLRAVFHLHISQKDAETAANLFKNI